MGNKNGILGVTKTVKNIFGKMLPYQNHYYLDSLERNKNRKINAVFVILLPFCYPKKPLFSRVFRLSVT